MSRIFMAGFEAGDPSMTIFNGGYGGDPTLTTTKQRTGGYGLDLLVDPAINKYSWVAHWVDGYGGVMLGGLTEVYIRMYLRIEATMDPNLEILRLSGGAYGAHDIVRFDLGGEVWGYSGGVWNDLGGMVVGMDNDDVYHRWEWYVRVSQSDVYPDGQVIIRRDGVEMYNQNNILTSEAANVTEIGRFGIGCQANLDFPVAVSAGHVYVDDIAINDTMNAVNASWPGEGAIVGLKVTGTSTHFDFTPTPGAGEGHYEDVDDIPPVDTTYLSSTAVGNIDTFLVEDPTTKGIGADSVIAAVQWLIRGKLPIAGSSSIHPYYVFRETVDAQLVAQVMDKIYFSYMQHIEDLDPVSDAPWLASSIRDSAFGFEQG